MIKTFTKDDLMRYLYHETSEEETKEISNALICDSELLVQYNDLCAAKKALDEARMEPSERVIQNILNYSRGIR